MEKRSPRGGIRCVGRKKRPRPTLAPYTQGISSIKDPGEGARHASVQATRLVGRGGGDGMG